MGRRNELGIPPAALRDSGAVEIVRIWIARNAQQVSLRVGIWPDPAAWGILLADLARHIANAHAEDVAGEPAEALARIVAAFQAEIEDATDEPTGSIQEP